MFRAQFARLATQLTRSQSHCPCAIYLSLDGVVPPTVRHAQRPKLLLYLKNFELYTPSPKL